jgi:hypothetical protein
MGRKAGSAPCVRISRNACTIPYFFHASCARYLRCAAEIEDRGYVQGFESGDAVGCDGGEIGAVVEDAVANCGGGGDGLAAYGAEVGEVVDLDEGGLELSSFIRGSYREARKGIKRERRIGTNESRADPALLRADTLRG